MPRTPPRNSTRNSTRTSREQPVARERRRRRRARPAFGGGPTSRTLSYDAAGNLIDDGQDYEYVYDAWHRLVRIEVRSSADIVSEHRYPPYGWGNGFRAGERYDSNEDGRVNSSDKWYWFGYDERWRIVGTFRDADSSPKERFLHHVAGMGGYGSSSYIDDLVLRDRDANTDWNDDASDGALEERIYYCQNWRHDVVALVSSGGALRERVRYTAYGIPVGMPQGDCDGDGDVDAADQSILLGAWGTSTAKCDLNLDGTVDATDNAILLGQLGATAGFGRLSLSGNRFGYAGYASDPAVHADWHVRHRVLMSGLGRWSRRDPIGYVDGSSLYAYSTSRVLSRTDPSGLASAPPDPCKQCNRDLKHDFGGVGVVKHLKQVIEDNCPHCHPLSVACRNPATEPNCTGRDIDGNPTPLRGFATEPPPGGCPAIGLCCGRADVGTYLHELMHAWDLCSANHMPQGLDTCKQCAWMEARAYAMMDNRCKVSDEDIRRGCASCKDTGRCDTEAICLDQWKQRDLNKSFELHPMPCTANYPRKRREQRGDFPWIPDMWQCGSQP